MRLLRDDMLEAKSPRRREMELEEEVKELLRETEKTLKGSARRLFMARTVRALGEGGQRLVERELGWNRGTIRKGQHELEQGIICLDAASWRGRKRSEEHLPNLLRDSQKLNCPRDAAARPQPCSRLFLAFPHRLC